MIIRAIVLLLLTFLPASALAGKRVALVVGNSAYQQTPRLTNPRNDATDVSSALRKHGFQVIEGVDLDKAAFDRKVRDFANALEDATAGLFFYAGHGLQVAGQNYLVPVDAQLTTAAALEFEMVRLDVVHRLMERQTSTNILFLDACGDNPLARNLARAMGTRSAEIGRGLAAVEFGIGTLISFSTQPGNVALDGVGQRNSPFAGALVRHITSSADDLSTQLIAVRNDVMKQTQRKQVPWEHSALTGRFFFAERPIAIQPSAQSTDDLAAMKAQLKRLEAELAKQKVASEQPAKKEAMVSTPQGAAPKAATEQEKQQAASEKEIGSWREAARRLTLKMQSYTPGSLGDKGFVANLHSTSGGKLNVEIVPAGTIVPGPAQLDAVSSGKLALGWSFPALWSERTMALQIFNGQVAQGHDASTFIRWIRTRGEADMNRLYQDHLGLKIQALACAVEGPEGIWFKEPISSVRDLKDLRVRTVGLSSDTMRKLGMHPTWIAAPGDIISAFEKGLIDAAEFSNPMLDDQVGLPRAAKTYYYPSFHAPVSLSELQVNAHEWSGLDDAQCALIRDACRRNLDASLLEINGKAERGLARIRAAGVQVREMPKEIFEAAVRARDEAVRELSARDSQFRSAWESYDSFK